MVASTAPLPVNQEQAGGTVLDPGALHYRYPLHGGAAAEVTFYGQRIMPIDVELLCDHLTLLKKALEYDNGAASHVVQRRRTADGTYTD